MVAKGLDRKQILASFENMNECNFDLWMAKSFICPVGRKKVRQNVYAFIYPLSSIRKLMNKYPKLKLK